MGWGVNRPRKTRILLGVTGSIAAYKAAELARYFMKRGCTVRVVMTASATKFISPLTFESITQQPVLSSFWEETRPGVIGHIQLADWADALVVAPASADFIAKAAHGFAESPPLAALLATKSPVVVAPAMNVNMYEHPQTQENIDHLKGRGVVFVEPESGDLACGWRGKGRLARPSEIYLATKRSLSSNDLLGKRVLITTGPTREALDPVRYISNRSSGKMGLALAREAYLRGADVTLIHGPVASLASIPRSVERVPVTSAIQMREAVLTRVGLGQKRPGADVVIMAAAVADYRPEETSTHKIKKATGQNSIAVTPNPDILFDLGRQRGSLSHPLLVGFAVETGSTADLRREAARKRESKSVDLIVGNLAEDSFDKETNQVVIVQGVGDPVELPTARKVDIAKGIFDVIARKLER
jgi:phosphopantothenoylcysteine decarboxylase/phosphopantothenate--cysteine ligase